MWYDVDPDHPDHWTAPSLGVFAASFFLFAVAMTVALLGAELAANLDLSRTVYTMAAAMLLAVPALFLYALGLDRPSTRNLWRLFWTFALLAYLVHLAWSLLFLSKLYYLEGSGLFGAIIDRYGYVITALNVVITLWWVVDVVLAWAGTRAAWVAWQRVAIQALVVIGSLVAALPAAENETTILAYVMVAAVVAGLIARFFTVAPVRAWRLSW